MADLRQSWLSLQPQLLLDQQKLGKTVASQVTPLSPRPQRSTSQLHCVIVVTKFRALQA
jgi:hypothetical protein